MITLFTANAPAPPYLERIQWLMSSDDTFHGDHDSGSPVTWWDVGVYPHPDGRPELWQVTRQYPPKRFIDAHPYDARATITVTRNSDPAKSAVPEIMWQLQVRIPFDQIADAQRFVVFDGEEGEDDGLGHLMEAGEQIWQQFKREPYSLLMRQALK